LDNVRNTLINNPDKPNRIDWYIETLNTLKEKGVLGNVLISHDSGWYNVGQENGGNYRGYTHIFEYLIPALKENGFTQDDVDQLLVKNPQKAYGVKVRLVERS
jgi:phosphotriesterase-related protein